MSPTIASTIVYVGIIALLIWDRDRDSRTSWAVWIAIAWVAIGGTRNVSEWLNGIDNVESPDKYLEGSPLDRFVLTGLLAAALFVLAARGQRTKEILRRNAPLVLFFGYCALSALWSDFPFVAFKRWTKALGNLAVVLILLTEADPIEAVKRFAARAGYILIPLSVLFIKYYPELGRAYDRWDGTAFYMGVATSKNGLGCILLVLGLPCLWRVMETLREKPLKSTELIVHGTMLAMVLWLFHMANSATSMSCFFIGGLIMAASLRGTGRPKRMHLVVVTLATAALLAYVFRDAYTYVVESLGRNTTLTGRTELWDDLVQMDNNPWFGTGFESFFLGDRIKVLWDKYWWHPNEAHNGYFEIYLTLGRTGLLLLGLMIVSGYRNIVAAYRRDPAFGTIRLAYLATAIVYNFTEAAFKVMNPVWIAFTLAVTAVPEAAGQVIESAERKPVESEKSSAAAQPKAVHKWRPPQVISKPSHANT